MCSIDLDPCSVARETGRRARKEHSCDTCGARILPGTTYRYFSWVFEGRAGSGKQCTACREDMSNFAEAHDTYPADPGGFVELLSQCIDSRDEESERVWRPMLERIEARRKAAA
jgi:hypothetical protein